MSMALTIYSKPEGESPVIDFLLSLSEKERGKCYAYMKMLEDRGNRLGSQYVKHIVGDVWELRPEFGGVEMRFFYFAWVDDQLVIVHAIKKKTQKTKASDIKLALKRTKEVKDGNAYLIQIFP